MCNVEFRHRMAASVEGRGNKPRFFFRGRELVQDMQVMYHEA